MFVIKQGNKYYFDRKNGTPIWGERKALAKRYSSDDEFEKDFKNSKSVKKVYLK